MTVVFDHGRIEVYLSGEVHRFFLRPGEQKDVQTRRGAFRFEHFTDEEGRRGYKTTLLT